MILVFILLNGLFSYLNFANWRVTGSKLSLFVSALCGMLLVHDIVKLLG